MQMRCHVVVQRWSFGPINEMPDTAGQFAILTLGHDVAKAAVPQRLRELASVRVALPVRKIDAENLLAARRVDADRNQNRVVADNAVLARLLVAGVQYQIGKRAIERPLREPRRPRPPARP